MTLVEYDIVPLKVEIQDLRGLLFLVTAVFALAILLVFLLVLTLTWWINR
jgi:hypothetical protein